MGSADAPLPATTPERGQWPAERLSLALSAGEVGTWEWDRAGGLVDWDATLERLYGLEEGTFGGAFEDWVTLLHPDDRDEVLAAVERSMENRSSHEVVHRIVRPDGKVRWIHGKGVVKVDDRGAVSGMIGVALDITERREAEVERERLLEAERQTRERLEFLARASAVLAQSLDPHTTLRQVANLAVPFLADLCAIELADNRRLSLAAIVHREPDRASVAQTLRDQYELLPDAGVGRVFQSGESEIWPDITEEDLRAFAQDDRHLDLLRALGPRSAMMVPLRARGQVIGVLTLVQAESGRRHERDDLLLVEELARRAAVAVDNARLFEQRAHVARVLQRSLLPPDLPAIPGSEVAARHQPAAPGWDISGDCYDVFENADRSWTLLLGDVMGKGPEAAVLTGLVRHTIRAAMLRDTDPARVLGVLNEALARHEDPEGFCTAVVAIVRPGEGRLAVDVASAGHPPPVTVRAGGALETGAPGGLPLGLFADCEAAPERVVLEAGDALVLCTDGVTEARRGQEEFGHDRLHDILRSAAGSSAEAIADSVLHEVEAFRDGQARDDTALLVLRARP